MATKAAEIRHFLLRQIPTHPRDVTNLAVSEFGVSRQAINRHLRDLVADGLVKAQGRTKGRSYEVVTELERAVIPLDGQVNEDRLWREWAAPRLEGLPRNVRDICHHGFTEMVNNVVDHSEGTRVGISLSRSPALIDLRVDDDGVGIFRKIQTAFALEDEKHAVLELSKGKLTTDPSRHSGEGVFFTSRIFDQFSLLSGSLLLCHLPDDSDWLVEDKRPSTGTIVKMVIDPESTRTIKEVFDRFSDVEGDYSFDVTHVPVALAQYGDENLVSRSQAKRLLVRLDRFGTVILNFQGVRAVGQAFADEVFRVFQLEHPEIKIGFVNASEPVRQMIQRALSHDQIPLL